MKAKWLLIIFGVLVILVALLAVLFRSARLGQAVPVSIFFAGYTNQSGSCMAVLEVSNRSSAVFNCFVGPRVSEADPRVHDLKEAASPGFLPAHGCFRFVVAAAADDNQWHVSVEVRELLEGLPPGLVSLLRRLHNTQYLLTSPAFSRPSP